MPYKILILSEDKKIQNKLTKDLEKEKYKTSSLLNLKKAIAKLKNRKIDVAIVDDENSKTGIKAIRALKKIEPKLPVIFLSNNSKEALLPAIKAGADDVIRKAQNTREILKSIKHSLDQKIPPIIIKKLMQLEIEKYIDKNLYLLKTDQSHTIQFHLKPRMVSQAVENSCLKCRRYKINKEKCNYKNDKDGCLRNLFSHGMIYATKYLARKDR